MRNSDGSVERPQRPPGTPPQTASAPPAARSAVSSAATERDGADLLTLYGLTDAEERERLLQAQSTTETVNFLQRILNESSPTPIYHPATVVAALAELGVRPGDRVLIMLPDSPGFLEAFDGVIRHRAVPLPVDPQLPAPDVAAAATTTGARLVVIPAERIPALTDLTPEPPVPIDGPHGRWAAALRAP